MKILKISFSRTIKTFANQHKIPRLPIPQLDKTVDKYLKSLEPIVDGNQLENSVKVANEFKNGFGKELQQRLVDYDKTQKNSWLETLWLENAYLKWREPSMINVNWWCEFKDHPEQPKELLIKKPPPGVISSFQVMRAAGLITNFLNFNDFLNREEIPAESIKGNPLCMAQYKNLFGTTRISGETMDKLLHHYPTTSQHIIVMIKGQMYKVDVYAKNKRVPLKELERVLLAVSKETLETEQQPAVGILTAGHRDNTFKGMNELRKLSEQNVQNLNIIETALFVVCLDDHSSKKNIDQSHLQIFHNRNGSNRWFDKSMQLIIGNNGRAGLNGEHSPADAVVPGTIVDYVIQNEPAVDPEESTNEPLAYPIKLTWTINDVVSKCLDEAGEVAQKLIDDTESCLLQTDIYGSRFIKEVGKRSF
jgi:carnitine O-acetyltransferase